MKTLIVKYTPRKDRSVTNLLLQAFTDAVSHTDIEVLDLCIDPPEFFTEKSIEAYYQKNLMGKPLDAQQQRALECMHRMTKQLKAADVVVLAFPMFNFSMPGAIKAWFDSVLHVGETVQPSNGRYVGLMSGKKALILVAAGGIYSHGEGIGPYFGPEWEFAVSLARREFQFIGYSEIEGVLAEGMAALPEAERSVKLNEAIDRIKCIADTWYN
jgi:FMN-dependent NADH-azoreductase